MVNLTVANYFYIANSAANHIRLLYKCASTSSVPHTVDSGRDLSLAYFSDLGLKSNVRPVTKEKNILVWGS